MSETKTDYTGGVGGYLFVQCALLVIHFGFNKLLPWWVLWFPSIICLTVLTIVLIVLLIAFIIKR